MDMTKIGSRIREERKKRNFTIAELSERVGISSNFLGNIERGVDAPSVETLVSVANSLFVGVDTLLEDSLEISNKEDNPVDFESMEIAKEIKAMTKSQKQCVLSCIKSLKDYNR